MKIYKHIKLDIDTWEVIEENSYEYNGIVAECQRDNNSGCPEDKVKECKAWPCNINDTTNEIMIADWCISSSSSSSSVSSSSFSSSSFSFSSSSKSSSSSSVSSSSSSESSSSSSSSSSVSSSSVSSSSASFAVFFSFDAAKGGGTAQAQGDIPEVYNKNVLYDAQVNYAGWLCLSMVFDFQNGGGFTPNEDCRSLGAHRTGALINDAVGLTPCDQDITCPPFDTDNWEYYGLDADNWQFYNQRGFIFWYPTINDRNILVYYPGFVADRGTLRCQQEFGYNFFTPSKDDVRFPSWGSGFPQNPVGVKFFIGTIDEDWLIEVPSASGRWDGLNTRYNQVACCFSDFYWETSNSLDPITKEVWPTTYDVWEAGLIFTVSGAGNYVENVTSSLSFFTVDILPVGITYINDKIADGGLVQMCMRNHYDYGSDIPGFGFYDVPGYGYDNDQNVEIMYNPDGIHGTGFFDNPQTADDSVPRITVWGHYEYLSNTCFNDTFTGVSGTQPDPSKFSVKENDLDLAALDGAGNLAIDYINGPSGTHLDLFNRYRYWTEIEEADDVEFDVQLDWETYIANPPNSNDPRSWIAFLSFSDDPDDYETHRVFGVKLSNSAGNSHARYTMQRVGSSDVGGDTLCNPCSGGTFSGTIRLRFYVRNGYLYIIPYYMTDGIDTDWNTDLFFSRLLIASVPGKKWYLHFGSSMGEVTDASIKRGHETDLESIRVLLYNDVDCPSSSSSSVSSSSSSLSSSSSSSSSSSLSSSSESSSSSSLSSSSSSSLSSSSSSRSSSSSSSSVIPGACDNYFDNSFWQPNALDDGVWDGAEWDTYMSERNIHLVPQLSAGDWTDGYTNNYLVVALGNMSPAASGNIFLLFGGANGTINTGYNPYNDGNWIVFDISSRTAPYDTLALQRHPDDGDTVFSITNIRFCSSIPSSSSSSTSSSSSSSSSSESSSSSSSYSSSSISSSSFSSSSSVSSSSSSFSGSSSSSSESSSSASLTFDLKLDGFFFNTSGDAPWFEQGSTVHTPSTALQAGDIDDHEISRIDLIVEALPNGGDLTFYWKVSSESTWDWLQFYINGALQDEISGEVDWALKKYSININDNLHWVYEKDSSQSEGSDTGWLDSFSLSSSSVSSSSYSGVSSSSASSSSSSSQSAAP